MCENCHTGESHHLELFINTGFLFPSELHQESYKKYFYFIFHRYVTAKKTGYQAGFMISYRFLHK